MRRPDLRPSEEMPPEHLLRFDREAWGSGDLADQVARWMGARRLWSREHDESWPVQVGPIAGAALFAYVAGKMRRWAGVGDAPDEWHMAVRAERERLGGDRMTGWTARSGADPYASGARPEGTP